MRRGEVIILSALVCTSWCVELRFPAGFKFGAATAAYQVEGAWNASDKAVSICDRMWQGHPERVTDGSSGAVACNSYELWERDIEIAQELGLHFYRFSISWPRLLPSGFPNRISEDGASYYSNLIDGLLKVGIEPMVTLYHWDLPQKLQDLGGWTNPLVADWFADYARVVYSLYGDRVKTWVTINEPMVFCGMGYGDTILAPGLQSPDMGYYLCAKNTMIAHAKAYRVYDEEFRAEQNGKVSLTNHIWWYEPATPDDEALAEFLNQFGTGVFAHPIFSEEGGWPADVEARMAEKSKAEGYTRSRLPEFTQEEIDLVRGTYDYFGMNHYTSRLVRPARAGETVPAWPVTGCPEFNVIYETASHWPGDHNWLFEYPEGLRHALKWVKEQYGGPEVIILENGYSTPASVDHLNDHRRINYYRTYLEQVLASIQEDGVNITGYTAWTMIDNFEWWEGFASKFGLYAVDFSSELRTRTPRKSARYYASVIRAHSLDVPDLKDEL